MVEFTGRFKAIGGLATPWRTHKKSAVCPLKSAIFRWTKSESAVDPLRLFRVGVPYTVKSFIIYDNDVRAF